MLASDVIVGTVLSEKAVGLKETSQVYTFLVQKKATKADVVLALKKLFNVDVVKVNTSILRGKTVRKMVSKKRPAIEVTKTNKKKAFVVLKAGQTIATVYDQNTASDAQ